MILHFAFSFNIGNLVTGLSIVGAAIALALRESLENLIASFIIFFDKPFTTGDLVKVQNVTGNVEKIGLRSTRLRTADKSYVTVPNKQMVDSVLDNLSLRTQRRNEIRLEVDLLTPADKLKLMVEEIRKLISREEIEDSSVYMTEIQSHAYIVVGEYFTAPITVSEFNNLRQEINLQVLALLENEGIKLVGPRR
jgi:MscS family membrane protein